MLSVRYISRNTCRVTAALQPTLHRMYAIESASMASITDAITKDHRELEHYYNEVIQNPDRHDHQQRFGNQFTWELARHSIGEELVVYPAFEKYLGDKGKQMAEDDRKEHHQVGLPCIDT